MVYHILVQSPFVHPFFVLFVMFVQCPVMCNCALVGLILWSIVHLLMNWFSFLVSNGRHSNYSLPKCNPISVVSAIFLVYIGGFLQAGDTIWIFSSLWCWCCRWHCWMHYQLLWNISWWRSLPVWNLCTLLRPFSGLRCHLAGALVGFHLLPI